MLTFELSRFEFNQALGRPEKIHNKLEFPSMIYMDRYESVNESVNACMCNQASSLLP